MTFKEIENWFHGIFTKAEAEIITYSTPALKYVEENGGKAALAIAEGVLAGALSGTPWGALLASMATEAEAAGIRLAEGAAAARTAATAS